MLTVALYGLVDSKPVVLLQRSTVDFVVVAVELFPGSDVVRDQPNSWTWSSRCLEFEAEVVDLCCYLQLLADQELPLAAGD